MILRRKLKFFSDLLQSFPKVWKLAVMAYEIRVFNPAKFKYKRNIANISEEIFVGGKYDIIFDAQCLQTQTLKRGIGKYSLNFISAICKARPDCSFAAILTTIPLREDLLIAKDSLENLKCSNLDVIVIDPFKNKKWVTLFEAQRNIVREIESTGCRLTLSLSPFERPDSVIILPASPKYKQVAIFYDLIRLQFPNELLFSRWQRSAYGWSLSLLKNFDLLLSISEDSKQHWANLVSSETKIEVIYGAADKVFVDQHKKFNERFGILCVGAEQPHKNIVQLIEAYCQLPLEVQDKNDLTIVGIRSFGVRNRLLKIARHAKGNIDIPKYLTTQDLIKLYQNSRLLVMPSIAEGLSLPILEAWSHGLVAIASATTVAQELIAVDSLLFDPYNLDAIAGCMNQLLTLEDYWYRGLEHSIKRSSLFTWHSTADLALNAIEAAIND